MATCRECLHFETCLNENQQTRYYGEKEACNNVQDLCRYFLSKSDYVKRERGEWKYNEYGQMYCSICELYPELAIEKPYCPNCGADMRKEDNNER